MFEIIISRKAFEQIKKAQIHYLEIDSILEERFLSALQNGFERIKTHPQNYSFIKEDKLKKRRSLILRIFPYSIIYEPLDSVILVYTLHHHKQNPKNKLKK